MRMAGLRTTINLRKYMEMGRELIGSLLFPKRCPVCDEILEPEEMKKGIHSACESKLYPIHGAVCMHCGRPLGNQSSKEYCYDCVNKGHDRCSAIIQAKALFLYKGAIKKAMYRFKYSNKREYADFFAMTGIANYGWWLKRMGVEAIIPVPLFKGKKKKRGYNQAESFAKALSRYAQIPVNPNLVTRRINTTPQKGLSLNQRKINVEKAFQINKNVVNYKCVMVVDDIYTTGSTAEAVAEQLIKQGIHRVCLMTICIGEEM